MAEARLLRSRVAMKTLRLLTLPALVALFVCTGCKQLGQYIDTTPLPAGNQVLTGTVTWPAGSILPDNAMLTVLLIDDASNTVLASQRLERPAGASVAFELAYRGEDLESPRRPRVEARVSTGGRLSHSSTRQKNFLTQANFRQSFALTVSPLAAATSTGAVAASYVVQPGDTAASIAQQSGLSLVELALANPGVDLASLKSGQKIDLPAAAK
jgi:uncharacterized lipoprotein YbaY